MKRKGRSALITGGGRGASGSRKTGILRPDFVGAQNDKQETFRAPAGYMLARGLMRLVPRGALKRCLASGMGTLTLISV